MAPRPLPAGAPTVLVVEDSPVNRVVATRVVERCGYQVNAVNNGQEALDALSARHYDAILMDCQMPELDGYAATREIRRREGSDRHTPIIAMTAHAMNGDRERCLDAGMDDYVSKPVRAQTLVEVLRRWIPDEDPSPPTRLPLPHEQRQRTRIAALRDRTTLPTRPRRSPVAPRGQRSRCDPLRPVG